VLVDDATRAGLVRGRQSTRGIGHIGVEKRAERIVCLCAGDAEQEEEKLLLAFGQISKGRDDHGDIEFALSLFDGGGMSPGCVKVTAGGGTPDLDEPLRTTANGANLLAHAGARTPRLPRAAQGADHLGSELRTGYLDRQSLGAGVSRARRGGDTPPSWCVQWCAVIEQYIPQNPAERQLQHT
jgi:hypothetical protein